MRTFRTGFTVLYLLIVAAVSVTVTRPEFAALSLAGALSAGCVLRGRKGAAFALKICLPALVLAALVNPLVNHLGVTVLFYLFDNPVTAEACVYGLAAGGMFAAVLMWFYALGSAVSGAEFAAMLGRALPKTALILNTAFGCEPKLRRDVAAIAEARALLGEKKTVRGGLKVLDTAVGCALEDAADTAVQMRARGFGLRPRTRYGAKKGGTVFFIAAAACLAAVVAARIAAAPYWYYPVYTMPYAAADIAAAVAFGVLCFLPAAAGLTEALRWRLSRSRI